MLDRVEHQVVEGIGPGSRDGQIGGRQRSAQPSSTAITSPGRAPRYVRRGHGNSLGSQPPDRDTRALAPANVDQAPGGGYRPSS
jgi:hypothetical protein